MLGDGLLLLWYIHPRFHRTPSGFHLAGNKIPCLIGLRHLQRQVRGMSGRLGFLRFLQEQLLWHCRDPPYSSSKCSNKMIHAKSPTPPSNSNSVKCNGPRLVARNLDVCQNEKPRYAKAKDKREETSTLQNRHMRYNMI